MKILAIGNSFSQDATHFLHQIAAADGVETKVVNLYIGGCSLEMHWKNIENDAALYLYEENGIPTEKYVSIKAALDMEKWDYIITQQASHYSGIVESYYPYIEKIADYIRENAPSAEVILQQTWAYEIDSQHPMFINYNNSQQEMYERLTCAYKKAAEKIDVRIIPCGDAIQRLRKKEPFLYNQGGMSICRDGFHMNIVYGRYLLAAMWYKTFTGNSIIKNMYIPSTYLAPNVVCNEEILSIIKETVDEMI